MNMSEAKERLLERTVLGEINWRPTEQRNAVSVRLDAASIVLVNHEVSEAEPGSIEAIMSVTMVQKRGIGLELRNIDGKTVGRLSVKPEDEDFERMQELWNRAYSKAYRVRETFDALDAALSNEGPIG